MRKDKIDAWEVLITAILAAGALAAVVTFICIVGFDAACHALP